jgi:uncharacterized membrane protein
VSRQVVLAFKDECGAEEMRHGLARLRKEHLIPLAEPAVVVRSQDGRVKVKPTIRLAGPAALLGAFWGVMVGLLFATPWFGLGIGAALGTITGVLADIGVRDAFIRVVGKSIEPGHSALLLLVHDWADDQVLEKESIPFDGQVLPTPLVTMEQTGLEPVFGEKE